MPRRDAKKTTHTERGSQPEPRFLIVGRIRKPHGIHGNLKVAVQSDDPKRFYTLDRVFISRDAVDATPREMHIEKVHFHHHDAVIKFIGVNDRDEAKLLNSQWLFVAIEDAVTLEEGEMYTFQLWGLTVVTTTGQTVGTVATVLETGANDVLVVNSEKGEVLIPDIPSVVKLVDLVAKQITIEPMDGLLPE